MALEWNLIWIRKIEGNDRAMGGKVLSKSGERPQVSTKKRKTDYSSESDSSQLHETHFLGNLPKGLRIHLSHVLAGNW